MASHFNMLTKVNYRHECFIEVSPGKGEKGVIVSNKEGHFINKWANTLLAPLHFLSNKAMREPSELNAKAELRHAMVLVKLQEQLWFNSGPGERNDHKVLSYSIPLNAFLNKAQRQEFIQVLIPKHNVHATLRPGDKKMVATSLKGKATTRRNIHTSYLEAMMSLEHKVIGKKHQNVVTLELPTQHFSKAFMGFLKRKSDLRRLVGAKTMTFNAGTDDKTSISFKFHTNEHVSRSRVAAVLYNEIKAKLHDWQFYTLTSVKSSGVTAVPFGKFRRLLTGNPESFNRYGYIRFSDNSEKEQFVRWIANNPHFKGAQVSMRPSGLMLGEGVEYAFNIKRKSYNKHHRGLNVLMSVKFWLSLVYVLSGLWLLGMVFKAISMIRSSIEINKKVKGSKSERTDEEQSGPDTNMETRLKQLETLYISEYREDSDEGLEHMSGTDTEGFLSAPYESAPIPGFYLNRQAKQDGGFMSGSDDDDLLFSQDETQKCMSATAKNIPHASVETAYADINPDIYDDIAAELESQLKRRNPDLGWLEALGLSSFVATADDQLKLRLPKTKNKRKLNPQEETNIKNLLDFAFSRVRKVFAEKDIRISGEWQLNEAGSQFELSLRDEARLRFS